MKVEYFIWRDRHSLDPSRDWVYRVTNARANSQYWDPSRGAWVPSLYDRTLLLREPDVKPATDEEIAQMILLGEITA